MKALYFLFLRPTSRKCSMFGSSHVVLTNECPQDRCGPSKLLNTILHDQCNCCSDRPSAHALPPGCHSGFAIRHGYPKCVDPTIQTHRFPFGRSSAPGATAPFPRERSGKAEHLVILYVAHASLLMCAGLILPRSRADSHTVTKRLKSLPILGSAHGSDTPIIFGGGDLTNYLIHFATNLDPNGGLDTYWPPYTTKSPQLLTFYDSPLPTNVTLDTYRAEAMKFLTELSLVHPL